MPRKGPATGIKGSFDPRFITWGRYLLRDETELSCGRRFMIKMRKMGYLFGDSMGGLLLLVRRALRS